MRIVYYPIKNTPQEKNVKRVLSRIELSTDVANKLQLMENPLNDYIERIKFFSTKLRRLTSEIKDYNSDIKKNEKNIQGIENTLKGFNQERVRSWYKQKEKYENLFDVNTEAIGNKKVKIQEFKEKYNTFNKQIDEEISKNQKMQELQHKIHFVQKAIDIVGSSRSKVMAEIKRKISKRTEKDFFNLMWKTETFREVKIDDNYEIKLIHSDGYECLGSISGGEREVLALSFTMALHKISGFDAPILIDRPFAMVSGEPIDHVANILLNLSNEKQLILFLTPNDYDDVSHILNNSNCKLYEIKLSKDEKEIRIGDF